MFLLSVCVLGIAIGFCLRWPFVPVTVTALAIALGIEGEWHGKPFSSVAETAVWMVIILDLAFLVGTSARGLIAWYALGRKI